MSARPRPAHLTRETAAAFADADVVAMYPFRVPYAAEVFAVLAELIVDTPRAVLDVGCGPGNVCRLLAPRVERIDAVDVSPAMLALGKTLPGGDAPNLRWLHGRAEDVTLDGPYALVTAGESLHWMDWETALPRFHELLTPNGMLAILKAMAKPALWEDAQQAIIQRYSTVRNYQSFDLIEELTARGLFAVRGTREMAPTPFQQTIDAYIAALHSMSSLSRTQMGAERAAAFDAEIRALLAPYAEDDTLTFPLSGNVIWGRPLRRTA